MPPYDSDDGDDESIQDYTETKVLLGYAEEEARDDAISHLGGEPVRLLPLSSLPLSLPPSLHLVQVAAAHR